ncbi:hypothetical protein CEXT_767121 [Caerostris extrusa]|uniref:Uncharacterized protein n=1 Tax=Caerostris extrusa TaxID=172846 RepID=A0AAV4Q5R7_CAEEX|nr:hypothetical protein CEXT_767121 [Caerostris extrusa]
MLLRHSAASNCTKLQSSLFCQPRSSKSFFPFEEVCGPNGPTLLWMAGEIHSQNPSTFLPTNPINKTTPVTSKTFNSNQSMRNMTDKMVKLAFPSQRLPSSIIIFNPFQISKQTQYTSFSFGRDVKVTISHKFFAFLQKKKSIYIIAIKNITVRSNGHEQIVSNREQQRVLKTVDVF